jgi:hypothetical protein
MNFKFFIATLCAVVLAFSVGCGKSDNDDALSLDTIPVYPGASKGQSMANSSMGGLVSGSLQQYTTTDSYDDVLAFYKTRLAANNPQVLTHTSELGRQAALSVQRENGMVTVSVQEYTANDTVNITFMQVRN